jgi:hypothetical protein
MARWMPAKPPVAPWCVAVPPGEIGANGGTGEDGATGADGAAGAAREDGADGEDGEHGATAPVTTTTEEPGNGLSRRWRSNRDRSGRKWKRRARHARNRRHGARMQRPGGDSFASERDGGSRGRTSAQLVGRSSKPAWIPILTVTSTPGRFRTLRWSAMERRAATPLSGV